MPIDNVIEGAEIETAWGNDVADTINGLEATVAGKAATAHTHTHAATTGQTAGDHHTNANDPTAGEKAALVGSSGTPGSGNKYVTDADARNTNARTPSAHTHAAADTTGTASVVGHGPADHADQTRYLDIPRVQWVTNTTTGALLGTDPNVLSVLAMADAATQGCVTTFTVPDDWAGGAINGVIHWVPGSTDAVAHAVRWSITVKEIVAGTLVTGAGTTTNFTGASSAKTAGQLQVEAAQAILTPGAAGRRVQLELSRIGADAADTYVGVVNFVGMRLEYTATQ